MKRQFLILAFFAVGCMLFMQVGCQQEAEMAEGPAAAVAEPGEVEAVAGPNEPGPEITFEKDVFDFGEVGPNTKNTGQLKFTSTGQTPLKIVRLKPCCGVTAKVEEKKKEYAPGESGTIKIDWTSGSIPSTFKRQLVVVTNDKADPEKSVGVMAKTVLKVAWQPDRLKLFLDEENAGCSDITLTSVDDQPFSITGFASTADCITADYDSSVEATKFVLHPTVNTESLQKNLKGRINIKMSHPQAPAATILFDVLPKYTINPPLLIIFNAVPQEPITRSITVLNNYHKEFEVESVTSKNDTIAVELLEQTKITNGYQLNLQITPPELTDKVRFTDVLSINIKGGEKLTITCNGYYSRSKVKPKTS